MSTNIIPQDVIETKILFLRGKKVMLDRDLAQLYKVETRALNQAVRRNLARFPEDFMFQLTKEEADELLRSQFVTLRRGQHYKYLPYAFTENGVAMLSSILTHLPLDIYYQFILLYIQKYIRGEGMKFANVKELQRDASGIISLVEKGQDVLIIKRGKPAAVIYPLTEDTIEDYMIQHSPTIRKKIEEGLKDVREGRIIPIDDLLKARKARKRAKV